MALLFLPLTESHLNKLSALLLPKFKIWWQKWSINQFENVEIQSFCMSNSEINTALKTSCDGGRYI